MLCYARCRVGKITRSVLTYRPRGYAVTPEYPEKVYDLSRQNDVESTLEPLQSIV